jgi:hypothetical protein
LPTERDTQRQQGNRAPALVAEATAESGEPAIMGDAFKNACNAAPARPACIG